MALARQIVGADADPERQELARCFVEAHADVCRIRNRRYEFISQALRDPDFDTRKNLNKKVSTALRVIPGWPRCEEIPEEDIRFMFAKLTEPERFAAALTELPRRLPALERYERRALSRRNRAMRDFDETEQASRAAQCQPGPRHRD